MHMVKATIGGGFLGMPNAFHNAGMVIGIVGTVVLGLSVLNMMACIVSTHACTYKVYTIILSLLHTYGVKPYTIHPQQ